MTVLWKTLTCRHICRTPIFWWISDANPTQGITIETCHCTIGAAHWKWSSEIPRLCLSINCLQIFQIGFLTERLIYQRPNIPDTFLGDEIHSSPLDQDRKRVELNVCEYFKYFTLRLLCIYLKKKIFVISKVWSLTLLLKKKRPNEHLNL